MSNLFFVVSKLLQEGLDPFNWAILCFLVALAALAKKRTSLAMRVQSAGLLFLFIPSSGFIAEALMRPLEFAYPAQRTEDYPSVDAIVVLGGTTGALQAPRLEPEELRGARVQAAVRLFRAGKAKTVVVSGGPYRLAPGVFRNEAEDMRGVMEGLGVPRSAIVMEPDSRNTFENAVFTAALLKERNEKRILLVTSALHLPRAMALFQKQGVAAIPVPCSFLSGTNHGIVSGLKPEISNMQHSESAIKEYAGRFVYWLMGRA